MAADGDGAESGVRLGVAVVVVNYRTKELTVEAVRSVLGDPLLDEAVVVDNGSGDGSAAFLRSALSDPVVRVVESPTNVGFGRGANLGVATCSAPLVFLLNSDAVARPGALAALARVLADEPDVGVVAPAVYLDDGTLQPDVYGALPAPRASLRTHVPGVRSAGRRRPADRFPGWVSGVAMMMRRADFLTVGGFDPDFTMYLEDMDLCRRLQEQGKRVAREPDASVVHLVGRSTSDRAVRLDQFHESKAVYLRKAGASPFQLRCAAGLRVARRGVERLRARWRGRRD